MSRSSRTRTPTFRFNRNEDDLLEEVLESNKLNEESIDSFNVSIGSQDSSVSDPLNTSHMSVSGAVRERPSVRDFISSKLNKTRSLDEENTKESTNTSNWFNDMRVKLKEKIDERKREKERERHLNSSDSDLKTSEPDIQSRDSQSKNSFSIPLDENIQNNINELTADYPKESLVSSVEEITTQTLDSEDFFTDINESKTIVEESDNVSNISNLFSDLTKSPDLWTYNQVFNVSALLVALVSLAVSWLLPVPSFIRGIFFGSVLTTILFSVLIVYIISKFFVFKSAKNREPLSRGSLRIEVPNGVPNNEEIFKGWVYEFVGNYDERDSGFKVQLIFVRLHGSSLRLSKPKHDIKKSKLKPNSLPTFGSQRIFEFSKMSHKRVYLLLPKSVRNQKKYIWSKKYPICLELEDIKTKNINKLVLFIRNCRDKEEWFWKLRETINQTFYQPTSGTSGPPTPNWTSETMSSEMECLPRTESLDLGSLQSATTCSSNSDSPTSPTKELLILSKQLDYNMFMNKIMNYKSQNTSSLLWFNALISRICFDVLNEQFWSTYIATKIQRKLRRLRLPYFMESLTITEIDVGKTLPKFNDVPKPPIIDKRGLWIDFDITYSGGFTMTLETKLNLMKLKEQANGSQEMKSFTEKDELDLSDNESDSIITSSDEEVEEKPSLDPEDADTSKKQQKILKFVDKIASSQYFQKATENKYIKRAMEGVSKTALILTVQIQTLNGTLAINIPEPPTDRLWYGFRGNPDLVLSARPKLGEHEVSISQVTDIIERKLRSEFAKVLVMPNMDDLVIPVLMTNVDQFITVVP